VTRGLLNELLHRPTVMLRESTAQGEVGLRRIEIVRELFGLEQSAAPREKDDNAAIGN
jgi:glutamyl-tRNA reductase